MKLKLLGFSQSTFPSVSRSISLFNAALFVLFSLVHMASFARADDLDITLNQNVSIVKTVSLASKTDMVHVKVLLGYRTGCIAVKVELVESFDGTTLLLSQKNSEVASLLEVLEDNLDAKTFSKIRSILFPKLPPMFTCQAEMPVYGETFVTVNSEFQKSLTIRFDFSKNQMTVPEIQFREFQAVHL